MLQWIERKLKSNTHHKDDSVENTEVSLNKRSPVIKNSDKAKGYRTHRSLSDEMSMIDWDDEKNVGLLEDGVSLIRFWKSKIFLAKLYLANPLLHCIRN